jgi:Ca2+-binding RTX toxin-like protein
VFVPVVILVGSFLIPSASAAAPRCSGKRPTIVGTTGADALVGTDRKDVIVGLGGDDTIRGGDRGDLICAGKGDDVVKGGDGIDVLFGGRGDDRLIGGPGFYNQIIPGGGDDFVNGGPATPDSGDEVIYLGSPNGIVADLGAGTVTGQGNDEIVSIEWLIGSLHDDVLTGSDREHEVIFGADGNDVIEALGGDDSMAGGAGDDQIDGGDGFDFLADWTLTDIYGLTPVDGPLTVDLVVGTLTGNGSDTLAGIEGSNGSPGDDVMIGDGEDNDFIALHEGVDTVDAGAGDDVVDGGDGADDLDGGGGSDVLGHLDASAGMTIDLGAETTSQGDVFANFEDVVGTFFDDVISGDGGPNTIEGAEGADLLSGQAGDDVLFGAWSDGSDDGSPDSADGGDGTDECDAETETNCEADPPAAASGDLRDPISSGLLALGASPGLATHERERMTPRAWKIAIARAAE